MALSSGMRMFVFALMLSACSAYPKLDWPTGANPGAPPVLLPQASFVIPPGLADPGPALVARAAALRGAIKPVAR